MSIITNILPIAQIVIAVVLIIAIMLQQRGQGLGSAFGGDNSAFHSTKRGFEKTLFISTIILAILFVIANILALITK